jgi:hypothetical protein
MLERTIVTNIEKHCRKVGAYWMKIADKSSSGYPDLVVIYRGTVLFIEVKRPGGIVSGIQHFVLDRIRQAGGHTFIVYSVEEFKKIIDNI